jgi:plasmid replication initiation protein
MENNRSNLVVLDNRIVESVCEFSLVEKKVIYILLSEIRKGYKTSVNELDVSNLSLEDIRKGIRIDGEVLSQDFWYKLSTKEFAESVKIPSNNARKELQSIVESLRTKFVKIDFGEGIGYVKVNWVSSVMFDAKEDCIGIKWNKDILPLICDLKEYFVRLKVKEVLLLKSTYSWKLHEVLKLLRGIQDFKKNIVVPIDELKNLLNVPNSLQEYKYFKSKILNPAILELNAKKLYTGLYFREIKSNRRVIGLEWEWKTLEEIEKLKEKL